MILGEVVGSLWSSTQDPGFDGRSLKMIVPSDARTGSMSGATVVAVDLVGSQVGDKVLIVYEGGSARQCMGDPKSPAEAVIVGIVDRIDIKNGL